jgi:hypothetical protein
VQKVENWFIFEKSVPKSPLNRLYSIEGSKGKS